MIDRILVTSLRFEILDTSWHIIVHALGEATLTKLLLDSLNSTCVLHHPFLYNDRDVMKVGSRTRSCLSASCGMCYPLLYRWTQQVELRNEENTCRYHWLVQRESHSEQFHNPCFTHQYPLCTPAPSIPFYVYNSVFSLYTHLRQNSPRDFKRWTSSQQGMMQRQIDPPVLLFLVDNFRKTMKMFVIFLGFHANSQAKQTHWI